ncbi:hypothetical protein THAOC_33981 [Thalassiosira oceanica]|uniref:Uncharacterized protein n=1 Tax=Thalassiosira oceanica TaxID=159749 RepID=K0R389_THAOC|nr:hypothetical protein THAOC_33981 [Thalassiosira oceanica]|eukprot:EJK47308.1 hypothetical protein THAOC_33981 [Thalassiosira oceanica]
MSVPGGNFLFPKLVVVVSRLKSFAKVQARTRRTTPTPVGTASSRGVLWACSRVSACICRVKLRIPILDKDGTSEDGGLKGDFENSGRGERYIHRNGGRAEPTVERDLIEGQLETFGGGVAWARMAINVQTEGTPVEDWRSRRRTTSRAPAEDRACPKAPAGALRSRALGAGRAPRQERLPEGGRRERGPRPLRRVRRLRLGRGGRRRVGGQVRDVSPLLPPALPRVPRVVVVVRTLRGCERDSSVGAEEDIVRTAGDAIDGRIARAYGKYAGEADHGTVCRMLSDALAIVEKLIWTRSAYQTTSRRLPPHGLRDDHAEPDQRPVRPAGGPGGAGIYQRRDSGADHHEPAGVRPPPGPVEELRPRGRGPRPEVAGVPRPPPVWPPNPRRWPSRSDDAAPRSTMMTVAVLGPDAKVIVKQTRPDLGHERGEAAAQARVRVRGARRERPRGEGEDQGRRGSREPAVRLPVDTAGQSEEREDATRTHVVSKVDAISGVRQVSFDSEEAAFNDWRSERSVSCGADLDEESQSEFVSNYLDGRNPSTG